MRVLIALIPAILAAADTIPVADPFASGAVAAGGVGGQPALAGLIVAGGSSVAILRIGGRCVVLPAGRSCSTPDGRLTFLRIEDESAVIRDAAGERLLAMAVADAPARPAATAAAPAAADAP